MDVYVLICEQLSANRFERLRTQDASRGSLGGWLAVVARHAVVDWIRSRKGRRRLFQAVKDLEPQDQQIFEMYYWENHTPSEIAELLAPPDKRADLAAVFESLERIQVALSARSRAELLALAARSQAPVPLEESLAADRLADPRSDLEGAARVAQMNAGLEGALGRLPAEDAAIVRLKYVEGLSLRDIERALGISTLSAKRVDEILGRLRASLEELGVGALP